MTPLPLCCSLPCSSNRAAAAVQPTPSVGAHYDSLLGSLTTLFSVFNVNAITPDRLTLGLQCVVGKISVTVVSDARGR